MTLQEKLAQRIYELLPDLAGEWITIDPEKIHYTDLVDKQVVNAWISLKEKGFNI